jgi:hypothetical protein
VGRPSAFFNPLQKSTGFTITTAVFLETGECFDEAVIKTGNEVGGEILQVANIKPNLNNGMVSPHIGAAEMLDAQDLNGFI